MKFSRSVKSSAHSVPSPNGAYIATVLPSRLILRTTRSLEILRTIPLQEALSTSISSFLWSSSSDKILLASASIIKVFSVSNAKFTATITNPTSETAKVTYITFGATDNEVVVFCDFGLKATIFKLKSSTSIDLQTPKLFTSGTASKGISYRPKTLHCALLSRSAGKDVISIHEHDTYRVLRSWYPDTVDAHSLTWSPDGKWLSVIECPGQGHKVIFYTADGYPYRTWHGPMPTSTEDQNSELGAGVKILEWNTQGEIIAIGDHSSRLSILSAPQFSANLSLNHTTTIKPANGLQIWQEQITPSQAGGFDRAYILASQITAPPATEISTSSPDTNSKLGTNILSVDASGTLIATRAENMPTTIWIWDIASRVLKVVLIQHAPVARVSWHPSINELLMIRCEGEQSKSLAHVWEPTWAAPKLIDFASHVPQGQVFGKTVARWLPSETPAIFFSDAQDFMLASISEDLDVEVPWQGEIPRAVNIYGEREESPLNLMQADEKISDGHNMQLSVGDQTAIWGNNDTVDMDDTFSFRKHG